MKFKVGDRVWCNGIFGNYGSGTVAEVRIDGCCVLLDSRPNNETWFWYEELKTIDYYEDFWERIKERSR